MPYKEPVYAAPRGGQAGVPALRSADHDQPRRCGDDGKPGAHPPVPEGPHGRRARVAAGAGPAQQDQPLARGYGRVAATDSAASVANTTSPAANLSAGARRTARLQRPMSARPYNSWTRCRMSFSRRAGAHRGAAGRARGQGCCPLCRAETAPLGESGGAAGLEPPKCRKTALDAPTAARRTC